jgi:hypothetical protein
LDRQGKARAEGSTEPTQQAVFAGHASLPPSVWHVNAHLVLAVDSNESMLS